MFDESYYRNILKQYPETISKEQLWKLLHISKRVAKHYLDHGIIPCESNGQATHKYTIRTADAVAFMKKRDRCPEKYHVTIHSGKNKRVITHPTVEYTPAVMKVYRQLLDALAQPYPDLMTIKMIAELTGYSARTIQGWKLDGILRWFRDGPRLYAPKELVLRHMLSERFRGIGRKSAKHLEIIRKLSETFAK